MKKLLPLLFWIAIFSNPINAQVEKLTIPNIGTSYNLGYDIAMDDDKMIVGGTGLNLSLFGRAFFFQKYGTEWGLVSEVLPPVTNSTFGGSVAIDGDFAIVGEEEGFHNGVETGAAYVYQFNGTDWEFHSKLVASDGAYRDDFGTAVAISGNYAIVGAEWASSDIKKGKVYVFELVGNNWVEKAILEAPNGTLHATFGNDIAIQDDVIVVGAPAQDSNPGLFGREGEVYIYRLTGDNWILESQLLANEVVGRFGLKVAIDDHTVAVLSGYTGNFPNNDQGRAYVFDYQGGSWNLVQVLESSVPPTGGILNQPNGVSSSGINNNKSIDIEGDFLAIGIGFDDADDSTIGNDNNTLWRGSANIFKKINGTWEHQEKIRAPDSDNDDYFGFSTQIEDGTLIIGAYGDDNEGITNSGALYTFPLLPDVNPTDCSDISLSSQGFMELGEYDGHKYFISNTATLPADAQAIAQQNGGYLATIDNMGENEFLRQHITEMSYIGLNDAQTEGTLVWGNGDAVSYTNFDICSFCQPNTNENDYVIMHNWNGGWSWSKYYNERKYIVEIPCQPTTGGTPDLTLSNPTGLPTTVEVGDQVTVTFDLNNIGTAAVQGDYVTAAYFSTDAIFNAGDIYLEQLSQSNTPIGTVQDLQLSFSIPNVADGNYYILIIADVNGEVTELEVLNNGLEISISVQGGTTGGTPDLTLSNPTGLPATVEVGEQVTVTFDLNNIGTGAVTGDYLTAAYFSTDAVFNTGDIYLEQLSQSNTPVGTVEDLQLSFTIPSVADGNYYVLIIADINGEVTELEVLNNGLEIPITVQDATAGVCPTSLPGLTALGEFNGSKYFISNNTAPPSNAQFIAAQYDGYLAVINDQAENDFLQQHISEMAYIGLNDTQTEGNPVWENGDAVSYTNFDICSICNGNTELDDYVIMHDWNGGWSWSKDYSWRKYIVEIPCTSSSGSITLDCPDDLVIPVHPTLQFNSTLTSLTINGTTTCPDGGLDIRRTSPSGGLVLTGVSGTEYQVTYEGTDACGNETTCSYTVSFVDNPVSECLDTLAMGSIDCKEYLPNGNLRIVANNNNELTEYVINDLGEIISSQVLGLAVESTLEIENNVIVKRDASGNIISEQPINSSLVNQYYSLDKVIEFDNGYIIAGYKNEPIDIFTDAELTLIKVDINTNILSTSTLESKGYKKIVFVHDLVKVNDDRFVLIHHNGERVVSYENYWNLDYAMLDLYNSNLDSIFRDTISTTQVRSLYNFVVPANLRRTACGDWYIQQERGIFFLYTNWESKTISDTYINIENDGIEYLSTYSENRYVSYSNQPINYYGYRIYNHRFSEKLANGESLKVNYRARMDPSGLIAPYFLDDTTEYFQLSLLDINSDTLWSVEPTEKLPFKHLTKINENYFLLNGNLDATGTGVITFRNLDCFYPAPSSCPDEINGFTSIGEFNGSKYFISNEIARPADSQTVANQNGGYLAVINSQAENDFLQQHISEMAYIGLNDAQTEGTLVWGNGEAVSYTNFDICNFCEANTNDNDYVIMHNWNGGWSWSKYYNERKYIVEIPCGAMMDNSNVNALISNSQSQMDFANILTIVLEKIHPNPSMDFIYTTIQSPMEENVDLQIFNARGMLVKTIPTNLKVGKNVTRISIAELPNGVYSIFVPKADGKQRSMRFVKIEN